MCTHKTQSVISFSVMLKNMTEHDLWNYEGRTETYGNIFSRMLRNRKDALERGTALLHRITPFGNPGVNGYVLLTPAYRSLSRPSSPDSSQASAIDLYSLGHIIFSALSLTTGIFVCITFSNQAVIQSLAQKLLLFLNIRLKIFPYVSVLPS